MYKSIIKPLLFLLSPEKAHSLVMTFMKIGLNIPIFGKLIKRRFQIKDKRLQREVFGLTFPNPVGLAAGFDKDAKYFNEITALGFGFIEIGTVTLKGQPGNPQPRLFRLPKDNALINRMGFNNEGIEAMIQRLKKIYPNEIIIGGNIGKNKTTPNEKATEEYIQCFEMIFPYVDYFAVNVSSPNTPNLRQLQDKNPLTELLTKLQQQNSYKKKAKPILLKIAPDLSNKQLDDIIEIVETTKIAGVIATNTTIQRPSLKTKKQEVEDRGAGGLSGKPLKDRATEVIRYLNTKSKGNLTIIGVGGISSPKDAIEKLEAGASLIQIYTGLIYEGPALVRRINKAIVMSE